MSHPVRPTARRRARHVLLAVASVLTVAACGGVAEPAPTAAGYPLTVDNCGREVTISAPPSRLYVIGGEAGTLVHAAGGVDRISTFSPLIGEPLGAAAGPLGATEQVPIQSSRDISRELIINAMPDLVVSYGLNDFDPSDLAAAGIPTLIISGYCGGFGAGQSEVDDPLAGVYADIALLGRVLETEAEASAAVADLQARVDAVRDAAEAAPPDESTTAAVFVAGADSPLGAYGRRSMIHQQLDYAGLSNVFEDTDERLFEPNTEALIDAAPERIIVLYEPGDVTEQVVRDTITSRPELAGIPAVGAGEVLTLDFYHSGHGTLAVDGLERLGEQIGGRGSS
ncbi:ABC transporter substrate-binding protein [Actinoalloteichus fjordicus]|uniref:ABC-type Fe3+-hydroxamate transport system, periplasmic component n=1 Tax=Actinoalloteichus fjordicus TaxID=1612552 RepID=A0AAC9LFK4_9PSEU|nr:ABC transporter substrate-binding protein [Actinoalloteichus fjordicus]APU16466.1 ABC-type Fe3+-hydroxamate transport system, periplasmic component [Actinoalloteichus fjordicus]